MLCRPNWTKTVLSRRVIWLVVMAAIRVSCWP